LELHPVKTEGVQEAFHGVHAHEHTESNREEHEERDEKLLYSDLYVIFLTMIEEAMPVAWKPPPYFTRMSSRNTVASCE
jgi:hypothetical protein